MKDSITNFTEEMLSWLNYSLMFTNEVKAYNLSLSAYNDKMTQIKSQCKEIDDIINATNVNF